MSLVRVQLSHEKVEGTSFGRFQGIADVALAFHQEALLHVTLGFQDEAKLFHIKVHILDFDDTAQLCIESPRF